MCPTFKNIMKYLALLVFLLCFNQKIEAHAGIAVEIRDGCDRYLVIGTWHSSASEIRNTVNSSDKGLYIDLNLNDSFKNCCNGSTSSEFFTFTDYTFPKQSVKWNQITNASSTVSDLVNYFNNSFKGNPNTIIGYILMEGLQVGSNYTWSLTAQKKLTKFLIST